VSIWEFRKTIKRFEPDGSHPLRKSPGDLGRAHRTGPVVMLVQAPGYRIVRSPFACLNMRIFSSVVRRLPFIRLTPLAKVLRLTLFMDQFSEAQPLWPGSPNWSSSYVSLGTRLQDRSFSVRLSQYADLLLRRPAFAFHSSASLVKVSRRTSFMGQFYEAQPISLTFARINSRPYPSEIRSVRHCISVRPDHVRES